MDAAVGGGGRCAAFSFSSAAAAAVAAAAAAVAARSAACASSVSRSTPPRPLSAATLRSYARCTRAAAAMACTDATVSGSGTFTAATASAIDDSAAASRCRDVARSAATTSDTVWGGTAGGAGTSPTVETVLRLRRRCGSGAGAAPVACRPTIMCACADTRTAVGRRPTTDFIVRWGWSRQSRLFGMPGHRARRATHQRLATQAISRNQPPVV
jgi:hypothetical protein